MTRIDASASLEDKRRWRIVRRDSLTSVEGDIVAADEDSGECSLTVKGETKTFSFGPRGIRIVSRRR